MTMNDTISRGLPLDSRSDDPTADFRDVVQAADGDAEATRRLENRGEALRLLPRAVRGDRHAFAALRAADPLELDALCATLLTTEPPDGLAERHPELQLLLEAVRGSDIALHRLQRKKPSVGRLAGFLRDVCGAAESVANAGDGTITDGAAADVGLLVGEQHLREGNFSRALAAFSRAIEVEPTPDAYEGRARAYQGLAAADERMARTLRSSI
jgi:tetratricopeptide (TPR) repeat protein